MANETKQLKGLPLSFNIYAYDEQEVEECRKAIIAFIGHLASMGIAVEAKKVATAISNWQKNPIVRNRVIQHFKE